MGLFAISDLHLSFSCDKPMDIFKGWDNYIERLTANWKRVITENDTVVLPGDLSWALKLENALPDFKFVDALPGRKILLKGNHDLWWSTLSKMNTFFEGNNINTISILHNNFYKYGDYAICGTRGWMFEGKEENKIVLREAGRLRTSLEAGVKAGFKPIVFMHYPPAWDKNVCREFFDVLREYGIDTVYHGHIHGNGTHPVLQEIDGIKMRIISCDIIDFNPYRIL